jgi:hypothetical protein
MIGLPWASWYVQCWVFVGFGSILLATARRASSIVFQDRLPEDFG